MTVLRQISGRTMPPGPKEWWPLGSLAAFAADPLGFLMHIHARYGDLVHFKLGPVHTYSLADPTDIEYVLVKGHRNFIKHLALRRGRPAIGNGLLISEGEFWQRQRRLMQPAFHRDRIAAYGDDMVAYTDRMLRRWRHGEVRDIHEEMMHLTMSIVTKTLFDIDISDEADRIGRLASAVIEEWSALTLRPPFSDWMPLPGNLRFRRAIRELEAIIYRIIERRRGGEERGDLLSMLLQAQDDDGSGMTDKQLRDEVITLFGTGHETATSTLSWAWHLLGQHPQAEQRLAEEVESVLGDRLPASADLPRLRYAEMVVLETLRLYPPAWITGREAVRECEIGGHPVRRASLVIMPQWVIHRNPAYFADPQAFRPERWADGLEKRLHPYAYAPFGGGPRICIGKQFAMMEIVLLLATIAQRFRLSPAPGSAVVPAALVSVRPKPGLPMVLSRR